MAPSAGDVDGVLDSQPTAAEVGTFTVAEGEAVLFAYDATAGSSTTSAADSASAQVATTGRAAPSPVVATPPDLVVVPAPSRVFLVVPATGSRNARPRRWHTMKSHQLWLGTFPLPAGEYEYKVALNGTWDVNFGVGAQQGREYSAGLADDAEVTFLFSPQTGWATDDVSTPSPPSPAASRTSWAARRVVARLSAYLAARP